MINVIARIMLSLSLWGLTLVCGFGTAALWDVSADFQNAFGLFLTLLLTIAAVQHEVKGY